MIFGSISYGQTSIKQVVIKLGEVDSLEKVVIKHETMFAKVQDCISESLHYMCLYMDTKDEKYLKLQRLWSRRGKMLSIQLDKEYK